MSEHILPQKTVALVLNTTVSLTWGAPEFAQSFPESIIKRAVAMRLSCSTNATQSVYVGVRYRTLTKDYRVAERKSISLIPPSGTVEITPASVAALGLLNSDIVDITVELTSASNGSATITLIIDDDPPPLSNDPGDRFGLDSALADDYLPIVQTGGGIAVPGLVANPSLYTVPTGKRFYIDFFFVSLDPTPTWPGLFELQANIMIAGVNTLTRFRSSDVAIIQMFMPKIDTPLQGGDFIRFITDNDGSTNVNYTYNIFGREVF